LVKKCSNLLYIFLCFSNEGGGNFLEFPVPSAQAAWPGSAAMKRKAAAGTVTAHEMAGYWFGRAEVNPRWAWDGV
jgi:hypothetical protein